MHLLRGLQRQVTAIAGWRRSLVGCRRGVLGIMVLAAATMARFRANGGRGTLAMAGGDSVGVGIRCCTTLRLGLRMDGTWHTCPGRSTTAIMGSGGTMYPPLLVPSAA
jgi:hypothetical protein